jgi:hypothetical protein
VFAPISSTKTSRWASRSRLRRRAVPARPPSATRRVRSLPASFFSAESRTLESILLTVDSLTRTLATLSRYSRLSASVAAGRSLRSASSSRLASSPAFGLEPGLFYRGQRAPFVGHLGVALNGGEADGEGASGLALTHTSTEGLDYLLAQVFGVGIQELMMPLGQLRCKPL